MELISILKKIYHIKDVYFMNKKTKINLCNIEIMKDQNILHIPERMAMSFWITHVPFAFKIIEAAQPRVLVELGSHHGVSFCAFCQQVKRSALDCMCYAVDTWKGDPQNGFYNETVFWNLKEYVHRHYASFAYLVRSTFDDALSQFNDNSIDILHIDGFHSYEAMTHDFDAWLPKMSERGVVLMHDINAKIEGYGGVRAWNEIAARFPHFAFDHGYGLGVVLTGDKPPQALQDLAACTGNADAEAGIRRYFARAGAMLQRIHDLSLESDGLRTELNELRCAADRHAQEYETLLAEERRAADLRTQEYEAQIHKAREQIETVERSYTQSRSWRLTAPLRSAGRMLRKLSRAKCR